MNQFFLYAICLFVFGSTRLFSQVEIIVDAIPSNTPAGDTIFLTGDVNAWNPGDPSFRLQKDNILQVYHISLPAGSGTTQFKFTRGGWDRVEGTSNGGFVPNRSFTYGNGDTLFLQIAGWEDLSGGGSNSTAAANVEILTDSFYMPQLNRYRRIWVYLPPDYALSSHAYPVLYMQDGQNVFDASTSFSGEWQVDETLNDLHAQGDSGIIVVAIDNGGSERLNEYSPWVNPSYGGGQGEAYVAFLVETFKPHIDSLYRTLTGPQHTGIMGSSMGGLISTYAGIEHQDVFGRVGALSASYWFSSSSFTHVSQKGKQQDMRIYQLAGSTEGGNIPVDMWRMQDTLIAAGFDPEEVLSVEKSDGQHSEWFWEREFEAAYLWLFRSDPILSAESNPLLKDMSIFPNPARSTLQVTYFLEQAASIQYRILSTSGRVVMDSSVQTQGAGEQVMTVELSDSALSAGTYLIRLQIGDRFMTRQFVYSP